ncbi:hypothetical protein D9M68_1008210 [compost metagenome]
MPRWRATKLKSRLAPWAASCSTMARRMLWMRVRISPSSASHIARSSGLFSTEATTVAPWVGGLE